VNFGYPCLQNVRSLPEHHRTVLLLWCPDAEASLAVVLPVLVRLGLPGQPDSDLRGSLDYYSGLRVRPEWDREQHQERDHLPMREQVQCRVRHTK
jgi:hypothetical protein